ncbi:MAG TPA: hypothetical protein VIU15_06675 [Streptomyces sp.]
MSENSEVVESSEATPEAAPDPTEAIRAEIHKEYAGRLEEAEVRIQEAKAEGRTAALGEVSTELVTAELRLQALSAGTQLPDLQYLDLSTFEGENGRPDVNVVKAFVESLRPTDFALEFPDLMGAGHNKGGNQLPSAPSRDSRYRK